MPKEKKETLYELVKKEWDGKPADSYLSLGELVKLQYNGYEVKIADVAGKIKKGKKLAVPLMQIIKKRAAQQRNLENRMKKALNNNGEEFEIDLPEFKMPEITFPEFDKKEK